MAESKVAVFLSRVRAEEKMLLKAFEVSELALRVAALEQSISSRGGIDA